MPGWRVEADKRNGSADFGRRCRAPLRRRFGWEDYKGRSSGSQGSCSAIAPPSAPGRREPGEPWTPCAPVRGGRLWFVTYVAHGPGTGAGTGLYWVDDTLAVHKHPASVVGTSANRLVHPPTGEMILGPHLLDADNNVRTFDALAGHRLTAALTHLHEPKDKVYVLGMESEFGEADLCTLKAGRLFTLNDDLNWFRFT